MASSKDSARLDIVKSQPGGKTVKVKQPTNDVEFRAAELKRIGIGRGSPLTEKEVTGFKYAVDGLVFGTIPDEVFDEPDIFGEWWRWQRYLTDSAFQLIPIYSDEFNASIGILIPRGELLRIAEGAGLSWPDARQETLPNLIDLWRAAETKQSSPPERKRGQRTHPIVDRDDKTLTEEQLERWQRISEKGGPKEANEELNLDFTQGEKLRKRLDRRKRIAKKNAATKAE